MTLMQCYWEHLWGCIHHIISYYTCHYICIHDILFPAHAYRIVWGDNSIGIRQRARGTIGGTLSHSSRRQGVSSWGPTRVPGSSANFFSKRQAPEHFKPPLFYKISLESFMFDAIGYKSWIGNTWFVELPCLDKYTFNPM